MDFDGIWFLLLLSLFHLRANIQVAFDFYFVLFVIQQKVTQMTGFELIHFNHNYNKFSCTEMNVFLFG